jgi:PAS domain S-box-containing protein
MTKSESEFSYLRDPRLAVHALTPAPVWLWSADSDRILWANPAGASIFDATSPDTVAALRFESNHAASAQVARLVGTLPQGAAPRLERLRGFGATIGSTLICLCSLIKLANNSSAVLIISTERAGRDIALPERARRLLEDMEQPAAIFTADGELIVAQPRTRERLGNNLDLVALGAEKLAREASLNGSAEGEIQAGHITILKLGAGSTIALLVTFAEPHAISSNDTRARIAPIASPAVPNPVELEARSHHLPFRFVWQTDAETRFTLASQEFANLLGPKTAAGLNRNWIEIAQALKLDPQAQIANALAAHETFSGIVVSWPVDDSNEGLAAEMSGLPMFDRERQFKGFRGFGICRNLESLEEIRRLRTQSAPASPASISIEAPISMEAESKVLPFPSAPQPPAEEPALSPRERGAFQELARELNERLKKSAAKAKAPAADDFGAEPDVPLAHPTHESSKTILDAHENRPILDRLPVGILVYRLNSLIYANRAFLGWTGYPSLDALNEAGGLDSLFIESDDLSSPSDSRNGAKSLTIATVNGKQKPVKGRLFSAVWNNENALVLMVDTQAGSDNRVPDASLRRENHELKAILDTATDGVLVLDRDGRLLSANRSAQALFGYDAGDFLELSMGDLLAPESQRSVLQHLDRLAHGTGAGILDAGYEAIGRVRQGGLVPLYITIGRIEDGEKLCAVLRDLTAWKRTEEELTNAKRAAEKASTAKSDFLAKISHEIRTPLNAIIGFSEVMMDERFGPVGSERYRQYLKDIHASGGHLMSLLGDLLDLSKIETGKLDLTFVSVNLNNLVQQCVAIMQEQANRERVIIRTSLPASLPQIIADARSMRQIALNLLSNSIKFTGAGGQVIISTALTDDHEVVLRVRDTGTGMSEKELQTALEPFQQVAAAARWGSSGTGLGLPITKALTEANHARFRITSHIDDGTLVEVTFPTSRVLAQ